MDRIGQNYYLKGTKQRDYFYILQKEMQEYYFKALNYLNLPLISLNCIKILNTNDNIYPQYNPENKIITVHLHEPEAILKYHSKTKDMNNKDTDIFILFHEVAHYWHDIWHNKHFEKFKLKYKSPEYFSDKKVVYNKQNLEKHANNIAKILYKRVYKDNI